MAVLTFQVDNAETRLLNDRQSFVADGRFWDMANSSSTFLDAVTDTLFLLPYQLDSSWTSTSAGNYKRLGKADYLLTTPSAWVEHNLKFNGDTYLHSENVNEKVYIGGAFEKNQGIFLSWYAYNAGDDAFVQLECGWGEGTIGDVRLRFWSDGTVEVWRNGAQVGDGNLFDVLPYLSTDGATPTSGAIASMLANQTLDVMVMPFRRRELLVIANTGGGFNHAFAEIDTNDPNPTITGPGLFWWYAPSGQATVQAAKLSFPTTGYGVTKIYRFNEAPQGGQTKTVTPYYDNPGYGSTSVSASLKTTDLSSDFTADGSATDGRIKVTLNGSGTSTPFVYGASAVYAANTASTPATPTTLDPYILSCDLSVGEEPASVEMTLHLKSPDAIDTAGASKSRIVSNRPFVAKLGMIAILTGRTQSPEYEESVRDEARDMLWQVRDYWCVFERYLMKSVEPLDNLQLDAGFRYLAKLPGFTDAQMDIDVIDFPLPTTSVASKGEFALYPKVGDKVSDWITRLWDTYAKQCLIGWKPTATGPKFQVKLPDSLATTPDVTLYASDADAQNYGGVAAGSWKRWYRKYKQTILPPEANQIVVTGRNPRSRLPLISIIDDPASQDATTAIASRPDNWWGEILPVALRDDAITTQEAANFAIATLRSRLFGIRTVAEWECDFLIKGDGSPVWRGDCVGLYGKGLFRVTSLSGKTQLEVSSPSEQTWRPFTYTGYKIGSLP